MSPKQSGVPVVIDNGSATCVAGFGKEEEPKCVIPSLIGRTRQNGDIYVGEEAIARKRDIPDWKYPIERGTITNWEDMENVWHHIFHDKLEVQPEENAVLLTESPTNSNANRERMGEIMFETFRTPSVYIAKDGVLSLYSAGRKTGVVMESGHGVTHMIPCVDGFAVKEGVIKLEMGGDDLNTYLGKLLADKGISVQSREVLQDIKEELCYVSLDYNKDVETAGESSIDRKYELPDGQTITVGSERMSVPEALFQPSFIGKGLSGIDSSVSDSTKCNEGARKDLFGNIVLAGGSSLFPGMSERMQKEIELLAPAGMSVKIISHPSRQFSAWYGGSILACLDDFQKLWVTKEEYEEVGASIINKKCF